MSNWHWNTRDGETTYLELALEHCGVHQKEQERATG